MNKLNQIWKILDRERLSQRALARKIGVSSGHLNEVLSGKRPLTEQIEIKIDKALGLDAPLMDDQDPDSITFNLKDVSNRTYAEIYLSELKAQHLFPGLTAKQWVKLLKCLRKTAELASERAAK